MDGWGDEVGIRGWDDKGIRRWGKGNDKEWDMMGRDKEMRGWGDGGWGDDKEWGMRRCVLSDEFMRR